MRIFVTGATGYIGSAVVRELLEAGHQVVGIARSDTAAAALSAAGAEVHRGALDDLDSLRAGAAAADGVIHLAFNNISETTDFAAAGQTDLSAVEALGSALDLGNLSEAGRWPERTPQDRGLGICFGGCVRSAG